MLNFKILNIGLQALTGNEFKAYYYIANSMGKVNRWKRLNHGYIAEAIGVSTKTAERITNSLNDKGFIQKDTKYSKKDGKRHTAFILNLDIDDLEMEEFVDIDVPKTTKVATPMSYIKSIQKNEKTYNKAIKQKEDIELFEQEMLNA